MQPRTLLNDAVRYVDELGWALTFIHASGDSPKAPLFLGWPDFRPDADHVRSILEFNADAGIGINLGGSRLVDVEADTPDGERLLDDLCHGDEFPCWQSKRGKHRLFLADDVGFRKNEKVGIEFRTGRHQSVLPPSVIGDTSYEWLVAPFSVPVSPMPACLREFYAELEKDPTTKHESNAVRLPAKRWPYRDDRDYVLRRFDLKSEVEKAGLRFVTTKPDANGNLPCFVPSQLRNGNEDEHASGVFNVFNGVLRDFATGKNHRFFQVLSALTNEPWQQLFAQYEAEADAVAGRPHSRRISFPCDLTTIERRPLEEVRAELGRYFDEQLSREPQAKVVHLIKGPPGVGKTYGLCTKLAEKRSKAIILTLENELASTHAQLLRSGGSYAQRMPVLRESPCPHPDDYERMARRGFRPSQSLPCRKCSIGPSSCPYLLGFRDLADADHLCAAAIYHTHDDFYNSHGNDARQILVFDENCIDLLLEPISHGLHQWQAWLNMVRRWNDTHDLTLGFAKLVEWLKRIEGEFLRAEDTIGNKLKFSPVQIPDDIRFAALPSTDALKAWLDKNASQAANRDVQNMTSAAIYLLTEPRSYVLLERIAKADQDVVVVRFRKRNPLPEGKEVFILDATASEELLRAVAPDWDVRVWECPAIEQAGEVIQIMDYDVSRNRIRKELASHEDLNPAWLVQVVDTILAKHGSAALITFKGVVDEGSPELDLLGKLKHRDRITRTDNFPCRGHTFDEETLIVVGTPYKDEASIWELALAIWGEQGLPTSDYYRRHFANGCFVSRLMSHEEEHLKPLHDFMVSADLVQAVGRVRPLQRKTRVFVISNGLVSDWDVQQVSASELFDLRQPLRRDKASRYSQYVQVARKLLETGRHVTNREICTKMSLAQRTGQSYWKQLRLDLKPEVEMGNGWIRKRQAVISL